MLMCYECGNRLCCKHLPNSDAVFISFLLIKEARNTCTLVTDRELVSGHTCRVGSNFTVRVLA